MKIITKNLLLKEQCSFRISCSCIDNVFTINQVIEKYREFDIETHLAFIDYEKAFDRVRRKDLWTILERKGYPKQLINIIRSMYDGTKIVIDTDGK